MNDTATKAPPVTITRADPTMPIFEAFAPHDIGIRAGTTIRIGDSVHTFAVQTPLRHGDFMPGEDYRIAIDDDGQPFAERARPTDPLGDDCIGGFHFAFGGCAEARAGGDDVPAINPHSIWDAGFRVAGADPRGMALATLPGGRRFWVDIYLLCADHKTFGTSRCGVTIADGDTLKRLNYDDAVTIYAGHGKRLLTYDEFRAAAYGVTEKSSANRHPKTTGLDAARTSAFGLMQATGNLWVWGTDGDHDDPRPSLFGGSWINGSTAGSRCARLVSWGGYSGDNLSARGAGDHLQPE